MKTTKRRVQKKQLRRVLRAVARLVKRGLDRHDLHEVSAHERDWIKYRHRTRVRRGRP